MLNIGLGAGLIIIALTTQWIISKRLKNQRVSKVYSWIAWVFALLGGVAISTDLGPQIGITSAGAVIASIVMLLFIGADLADRRPDWLAFILICLVPTFMRMSGGGFGALFDVILMPPDAGVQLVGRALGM